MNVPEEFKFRHVKVSSILKKCEVTNDVRYQECTEITLDFERQNKVKGYFFFVRRLWGGFFCWYFSKKWYNGCDQS